MDKTAELNSTAEQNAVEQAAAEQPTDAAPSFEEFLQEMRSGGIEAEDMPDEEVRETYEELYPGRSAAAQKPAEQPAQPEEEPSTAAPLRAEGFTVYIDDKPVEDLSGLTIADLLQRAKIGYQALGKEQRRTLSEVVRNASLGHLNARRTEQMQQDSRMLQETVQRLSSENANYKQQAQLWDAALQGALAGDMTLIEQLATEYRKQLGQQSVRSPDAERLEALQLELAGRQVLEREVRPYLQQLGKPYGFEGERYNELEEYVLGRIGAIPETLLTVDRVKRLLEQEIPLELEALRVAQPQTAAAAAAAAAPQPAASDPTVAALQQQVAALTAMIGELQSQLSGEALPPGSGPSSAASGPAGGGGSDSTLPHFADQSGNFDINKWNEWLRAG